MTLRGTPHREAFSNSTGQGGHSLPSKSSLHGQREGAQNRPRQRDKARTSGRWAGPAARPGARPGSHSRVPHAGSWGRQAVTSTDGPREPPEGARAGFRARSLTSHTKPDSGTTVREAHWTKLSTATCCFYPHSQLRGCFLEPLKLSKPAPVPLDKGSAPPVLGDSVTQQDPASTVWPRLLLETQLTDVTGSQPSGARHLSRGRHGCRAQVRACQSLVTATTVPTPGLQVSLGSLLSTYPALETQPRRRSSHTMSLPVNASDSRKCSPKALRGQRGTRRALGQTSP